MLFKNQKSRTQYHKHLDTKFVPQVREVQQQLRELRKQSEPKLQEIKKELIYLKTVSEKTQKNLEEKKKSLLREKLGHYWETLLFLSRKIGLSNRWDDPIESYVSGRNSNLFGGLFGRSRNKEEYDDEERPSLFGSLFGWRSSPREQESLKENKPNIETATQQLETMLREYCEQDSLRDKQKIVVYVWEMSLTKNQIGHVSSELMSGEHYEYISWWPGESKTENKIKATKEAIGFGSYTGVYMDTLNQDIINEDNRKPDARIVLHGLDVETFRRGVDNFKKNNHKFEWGLRSQVKNGIIVHNCASLTEELLSRAGIYGTIGKSRERVKRSPDMFDTFNDVLPSVLISAGISELATGWTKKVPLVGETIYNNTFVPVFGIAALPTVGTSYVVSELQQKPQYIAVSPKYIKRICQEYEKILADELKNQLKAIYNSLASIIEMHGKLLKENKDVLNLQTLINDAERRSKSIRNEEDLLLDKMRDIENELYIEGYRAAADYLNESEATDIKIKTAKGSQDIEKMFNERGVEMTPKLSFINSIFTSSTRISLTAYSLKFNSPSIAKFKIEKDPPEQLAQAFKNIFDDLPGEYFENQRKDSEESQRRLYK